MRAVLTKQFRPLVWAWIWVAIFAVGQASAWAQRPLGTDVSHWQASVNWPAVKNAGVTFAWAKATEGTYYTDPVFTTHADGAKAAGIYIGAYHFARPSLNPNLTGANSAETEAAYFWNVASNYVKGGGSYLVPMLDWEDIHATNGYNGFNGFTVSFMSAWLNQWCLTVSNFAKTSGVTLKPIVYTGVWYSQPSSAYPGLNTTVTNWPAWISAYPTNPNVQGGGPSSSYPWPTWTIWQYANTNWSGGDSDVLNGTFTNLDALVIGGLGLPAITSQPLWRAVDTGGSVTFAAAATTNTPFTYQWTFAGTKLSGATNATYTLTNAQAANAGNYALVVTNNAGSITSNPAWLLVYPLQATVFADNFDANTTPNWIINKSSSDTAAVFSFDYSALGIPAAPNSANSSTLGLQLKCNLIVSNVAALSLSPTNQNFSGDYRLHFDAWINVNGPFPGGGRGSTEYLTAGVGTAGTRTEWTGNASADGVYFSVNGDGGSADTATATADYNAYLGATVQAAGSGVYFAGTDTTARGNLNSYYINLFSAGQAAPAAQQAAYPQQSGNLNPGTAGLAWHDVIVSKRGTSVDWVVDGVRLAFVANATFTASNICVGFWDPFPSLSDNNNLSFGLVDNVRVEMPASAPCFVAQPSAQIVKLGTNVAFSTSATGLPAPNFQWRFNGTNISGATNATYALAFVAATNAGKYSVIATNLAGSVTSTNASLSLAPPIAAQFQAISVSNGALQISFSGDAYWAYSIEASTNLTDWSVLTNLVSPTGNFNFTSTTTNNAQQFFRARVGP